MEFKDILQICTILIAFFAIIVAILKKEILNKISPFLADINIFNNKGDFYINYVDYQSDQKLKRNDGWCYHCSVVNKNKNRVLRNCNVLLIKIEIYDNSSENWKLANYIVPRRFNWAPSELQLKEIDISNSYVFDFLKLQRYMAYKPEKRIIFPCINPMPNQQKDIFIFENKGKYRYYLRILADNFIQKNDIIFEVSWDGDFNIDNGNNIKISKISEDITNWSFMDYFYSYK